MHTLPTNVRDYCIALRDAGLRRFPEETRECRTLVLVVAYKQHVEMEIPEVLLREARAERRWKARIDGWVWEVKKATGHPDTICYPRDPKRIRPPKED